MDGVAQLTVESAQGFWKLFHLGIFVKYQSSGLSGRVLFSACDEASFFFSGMADVATWLGPYMSISSQNTQKHAKINYPPRYSVKHRNRSTVHSFVGIEKLVHLDSEIMQQTI